MALLVAVDTATASSSAENHAAHFRLIRRPALQKQNVVWPLKPADFPFDSSATGVFIVLNSAPCPLVASVGEQNNEGRFGEWNTTSVYDVGRSEHSNESKGPSNSERRHLLGQNRLGMLPFDVTLENTLHVFNIDMQESFRLFVVLLTLRCFVRLRASTMQQVEQWTYLALG